MNFVSCYFIEFIFSFNSLLVESLGFSISSITFPFLTWMPFISSFCLIAVASTSRTMLHKRGEHGHPCPVPDLKGNAFRFSPLSLMSAVVFSCIAFIMLRYVPSYFHFAERFYHKCVLA